jgi:hypothetical protein
VKSASIDVRPTPAPERSRRSAVTTSLAGLGMLALVVSACGGDDDTAATTTTSLAPTVTIAPTTTAAPTTTVVPVTTTLPPLVLVTEGATVVVANASGIDGAAGRMTDALAAVGFTTGTATNSSEGQLATTKIYFSPDNVNAKAVADSLREALGAGAIEVLELAVPAPTDDGEIGDGSILVAMGNDTADKPLDELQGRVAPVVDEPTGEATAEATADESSADG